jgi:hypothetical protein
MKTTKFFALMLASLAGLCHQTQAYWIGQSYFKPVAFTGLADQPFTTTVNGFDPALGELLGFHMALLVSSTSGGLSVDATNNTGSTANSHLSVRLGAQVDRSGTFVLDAYTFFNQQSPSQQSLPGQTITHTLASAGITNGTVVTNSAILDQFKSAGTISLDLTTRVVSYSDSAGLPVSPTPSGTLNAYAEIQLYYNYVVDKPPTAQTITINSFDTEAYAAYGVYWYEFQYAGGDLTLDTLGSDLDNGNDTKLSLWRADGTLVEENDDAIDFLSRLEFADGYLAHGTYYAAAYGYGGTAGSDNFSINPMGLGYTGGTIQLNITGTAVPEPGVALLLGTGLLATLARSRRRATPSL